MIYAIGSQQGMSHWWMHAIGAVFASIYLHRISSRYLFWFLLLVALFFAKEARFSIEYLLLFSGFFAWGMSDWWRNIKQETRAWFLMIIFTILFFTARYKFSFVERGSLFLWFPVFLSLYFQRKDYEKLFSKFNLKANIMNLVGAAMSLFTNKKTTLLAYVASLPHYFRSRLIYIAGVLMVGASFFFVEKFERFFNKSVISRVYIWQSAIMGWFDEFVWGHGLGTFTIDFPPYRAHLQVIGAKVHQQISHGHSMLTHMLFEQGLIGAVLFFVLFYLVYKKARPAFLPMLVICIFDAPAVNPAQYLLMSLILMPFLIEKPIKESKKEGLVELAAKEIPERYQKYSTILIYIVATVVFASSVVGHYYYDQAKFNYPSRLDKAIKWDPYNSLYRFTRGAMMLNKNPYQSEVDFLKAVELSPNVSYFHGFLAASKLANMKVAEAQKSIATALEMDGGDGYWLMLSALSHYNDEDKSLFEEHYRKSIKRNPEIEKILTDPGYTAAEYIGAVGGDARIAAFYRRGPRVYIPLPYIEKLPEISSNGDEL